MSTSQPASQAASSEPPDLYERNQRAWKAFQIADAEVDSSKPGTEERVRAEQKRAKAASDKASLDRERGDLYRSFGSTVRAQQMEFSAKSWEEAAHGYKEEVEETKGQSSTTQ